MTEKANDDTSVRVAVRIRPQLGREKVDRCQVITSVIDENNQVIMGKDKAFTFDYVYNMEKMQEHIYNDCVRVLIDGCFDGYNATVLAYGQTGSGKTYSMGTGFEVNVPMEDVGIVPRAVEHLFKGIEERKRIAAENNEPIPDFKVNAQFMELYNEEILDLLDTTRDPDSRKRKSHIKIHEDAGGGIYVVGVMTRPVKSLQETMQALKVGALSRATASTNMNVQSSRSHAIFTLHIKQQRIVHDDSIIDDGKEEDSTEKEVNEFETLTAKFHFVDLAGSERLKRTGATGDRQKEGISINCGLLALGNVISALGDQLKKGSHVPYRDSKLTRLLQDSLGGNSRTLMIACISPSDCDFMETLNTLKYANRARNIKNKITANQDKTSKQLALLRTEIVQLQQELIDYKSGKRIVDADGVDTFNDMFHENTMLQTENQKLLKRVKALNEANESLTMRNAQILSEKELMGLNITGDNCNINEEVSKLVLRYTTEVEELRARLSDSEAICNQMSRSVRTPSRASLSPMSAVPLTSSMDMPLSPDNSISSILQEAKKDVKKLKRKKGRHRHASHSSDKENASEGEKGHNEVDDVEHEESQEKSDDDDNPTEVNEVNEDDEDDEDDDIDDDFEDSTSNSDTDDDDSDIHENLAELSCEISIKQRLIDELEQTQTKMNVLKHQYEEKVVHLQTKIKTTELERDTVLANINHLESNTGDRNKKIKVEYEKKLTDLQQELKKMQAARKEHAKLLKNQSHHEKQLKTLQHEMGEMKKTKVKLMRQVKEETDRGRQNDVRRSKEIAILKRDQSKKDGIIRNLEADQRKKDVVLRRKQEEVEALRKRQKPKTMTSKAAGRVGKYERPTTIPVAPISSPRRRRRNLFSPKAAKQKWDTIEKNMNAVVYKKLTVGHMEKDMENWLKHREKLGKKLEKYTKKRDVEVIAGNDTLSVHDLNDVIESLNTQVDIVQENIMECRNNIIQMEESKDEAENVDIFALMATCTLEEARYLLEHFLEKNIARGLQFAQKDSESRELQAKLHQTELNNTLQQDLLKHMMVDHVEIEVDNLMINDEDDIDTSSSSTSSPVDNMFDSLIPSLPPVTGVIQPSEKTITKKEKARRRTATPDELLFVGESAGLMMAPVLESVSEEGSSPLRGAHDMMGIPDMALMPPPRLPGAKPSSFIPRPTSSGSSRPEPSSSPRFPRKDIRPSPEPSPVLRRKNSFTINDRNIRSSSADTLSSDTTPPSSPPAMRRNQNRDENVFSRLTSKTQTASPNPNRGNIVASSARPASARSAPLYFTHKATGHTKAVLSVYATDELLFSGSKDRTAKIWDLSTGKEIQSLTGHPNNVVKVNYCQKTKLVFTVSQSYIKIWDLREPTAKCIKTLSSSGLTLDGPISHTSSRSIELPPGEHHITDAELNQDGNVLYCAIGNFVRLWDLRRFGAIGKLNCGHQAAVMTLAVDRVGTRDIVVTGSKDHYIKVFDIIEGAAGALTPKYNLEPPHYDGIQSLALQGDTLFSGSRDACIKKWDLSDQQMKHSLNSAHKDWVCALDFMPNTPNILLSGCRGGVVKLWQVDTCALLGEIKAHSSPINVITTNSTSIFTASNDHTIGIWKGKSGMDSSDSSEFSEDKSSV